MTDTAGHVPISVAARLAGVHERTIRRWIAAGLLADSPGRSGGHRARLVDVAAVRDLAAGLTYVSTEPDTAGQESRTEPDRGQVEPDTSASEFLAVIERQQQTIMELSGRVGFYQARVQTLEERIALLEAPAVSPMGEAPTPRSYGPGEPENSAVWAVQTASEGVTAPDPANPLIESPESAPRAQPATETATAADEREPNGDPVSAQAAPWWAFWRRLV